MCKITIGTTFNHPSANQLRPIVLGLYASTAIQHICSFRYWYRPTGTTIAVVRVSLSTERSFTDALCLLCTQKNQFLFYERYT
jgi:hypothetical protein